METKVYASLDSAERGRQRVIKEWPKHLNMADKLWISISSDGKFRLQDYLGIADERFIDRNKHIVHMNEYAKSGQTN